MNWTPVTSEITRLISLDSIVLDAGDHNVLIVVVTLIANVVIVAIADDARADDAVADNAAAATTTRLCGCIISCVPSKGINAMLTLGMLPMGPLKITARFSNQHIASYIGARLSKRGVATSLRTFCA